MIVGLSTLVRRRWTAAAVAGSLFLSAWPDPSAGRSGHADGSVPKEQLANPAYEKCIADGYEIEPVVPNGIPIDADCINRATGKHCRVWAYFRGECRLAAERGGARASSSAGR